MQDGSRRRARLILIVGVALALVAGVGTFVYASGAKSDQPVAVPTVAVLVAAREIPAKTTLTTADVKLQEFNLDAKPAAAMSDAGEALGKITVQSISVGEPILPSKFSDPKLPGFVVMPASFIGPTAPVEPRRIRAMRSPCPTRALRVALLGRDIATGSRCSSIRRQVQAHAAADRRLQREDHPRAPADPREARDHLHDPCGRRDRRADRLSAVIRRTDRLPPARTEGRAGQWLDRRDVRRHLHELPRQDPREDQPVDRLAAGR